MVKRLGHVSQRAEAAIAAAGLVDFTDAFAADRLLAVRGCGRQTLREIAAAVALTGEQLGGFDQAMKGYDSCPTMTTEDAARSLGLEAATLVALAQRAGVVTRQRRDGRIWSPWSVISVRRYLWITETLTE